MAREMLDVVIIQLSQGNFLAPVVMVHKRKGSWHMYPYYKELNNMTIKYMFHIPGIDELLDELHGAVLIIILDTSNHHEARIHSKNNL